MKSVAKAKHSNRSSITSGSSAQNGTGQASQKRVTSGKVQPKRFYGSQDYNDPASALSSTGHVIKSKEVQNSKQNQRYIQQQLRHGEMNNTMKKPTSATRTQKGQSKPAAVAAAAQRKSAQGAGGAANKHAKSSSMTYQMSDSNLMSAVPKEVFFNDT